MPAPQASMMQMLAKTLFSANAIKVPANWQQPMGKPGDQYGKSFKMTEKMVPPDTMVPPLFQPASLNKYHVDTQKKLNQEYGSFIDGICSAICSAWSQWQSTATMSGIIVNAVTAMGGVLVGPPWTPLILASAPKEKPLELAFSTTIANVIGTGWLQWQNTVKVPGLPWYPAFAAFPSPMAPPTPNVPTPLASLINVPVSVSKAALKGQMVGQLGNPNAPYHQELFDCVAGAFEQCFNIWLPATQVTNVLGTGPVPSFAPPFVPVGPVLGGMATMAPGGLV